MRNGFAATLLMSVFVVAPAAAATCPGTVVLQDAFATPNTTLDLEAYPQDKIAIQGGKAEVTFLQAGFGRADEYWGTLLGDVNVCATVSEPATDKAENQAAGIIFWGASYNSYYTFQIQPAAGTYAVAEFTPGASGSTWTFPVTWTASAAVVKTMGSANTLQVETKGTTATLLINGQQVGTVTGTPPGGGGQVGFYVGSSTTSTSTWDVTNFSASSPLTTTAAASTACPGTPVFQDAFPTPDPLINIQTSTQSQVTTAGGKGEVILTVPSYGQMFEYTGNQYGDADVCATFNTLATDKAEGQVAGLIFWATDYTALYVFEINPTAGTYTVALRSGGNWTTSITSLPSAAVEKGMGKVNTLRVQTKGTAATLYINNQQVESVYDANPPAGGGVVGFYGESESTTTATETWQVGNFTVALE
ncbi:MAG: hypothetical protein ACLPZY_07605 [Terracidiphilus sp.]